MSEQLSSFYTTRESESDLNVEDTLDQLPMPSLSETEEAILSDYLNDEQNTTFGSEIPGLRHIWSKFPLAPLAFQVWRGVQLDEGQSYQEDWDSIISTSLDPDEALKFTSCCLLNIWISAGTPILPVWRMSEHPQEKEIILPPGRLVLLDTTLIPYVPYRDGHTEEEYDLNGCEIDYNDYSKYIHVNQFAQKQYRVRYIPNSRR